MTALADAAGYTGYFIAFVTSLLFVLSGIVDLSYGRWFKGLFVLGTAFVLFIAALAILPEGGVA